jgi:AcrR family transcriptional regulator
VPPRSATRWSSTCVGDPVPGCAADSDTIGNFSSKDDLLAVLAADAYREFGDRLTNAIESAGEEPFNRLAALAKAYVRFGLERRGRFRCFAYHVLLGRPRIAHITLAAPVKQPVQPIGIRPFRVPPPANLSASIGIPRRSNPPAATQGGHLATRVRRHAIETRRLICAVRGHSAKGALSLDIWK